jgi:hypothetical protein
VPIPSLYNSLFACFSIATVFFSFSPVEIWNTLIGRGQKYPQHFWKIHANRWLRDRLRWVSVAVSGTSQPADPFLIGVASVGTWRSDCAIHSMADYLGNGRALGVRDGLLTVFTVWQLRDAYGSTTNLILAGVASSLTHIVPDASIHR